MGCCQGYRRCELETLRQEIQKSICSKNLMKLIRLLSLIVKIFGSRSIISHFEVYKLNDSPLAIPEYCILLGCREIFEYINSHFDLNIRKIEKSFLRINTTALSILCSMNYYDLLVYYLPISLSYTNFSLRSSSTFSLCNNVFEEKASTFTPLQSACYYGHLGVVKYIFDFFHGNYKDPSFDVDYQDEIRGESCSFIACRMGCLPLLQLLKDHCNSNFSLLNKNNENLLQVLCSVDGKSEIKDFNEIFRYLIENTNINFTHNFEETLLLCSRLDIIKYYETKLFMVGICFTKNDLEKGPIPERGYSQNLTGVSIYNQ